LVLSAARTVTLARKPPPGTGCAKARLVPMEAPGARLPFRTISMAGPAGPTGPTQKVQLIAEVVCAHSEAERQPANKHLVQAGQVLASIIKYTTSY
jgi:hypothetical protein